MKTFHNIMLMSVVSLFLVGCGGGSSSSLPTTGGDIPGDDPTGGDTIDLTTIGENPDITVIKFVTEAERDRVVDFYKANIDPNATVYYEDMNCSSLTDYALVEDDVQLGGVSSPTGVLVDVWYDQREGDPVEHYWCSEYTYLPGTTSGGELIYNGFFATIAGLGGEDFDAIFLDGHIDGLNDDNNGSDGNGTVPDPSVLEGMPDITVVRNVSENEKDRIVSWYTSKVDPDSLVFYEDMNCSSLEGYVLSADDVKLGGKSPAPGVMADTWYLYDVNNTEDPYLWCNEYTYTEGTKTKSGEDAYGDIDLIIAGEGNKNSRAIFHDGHIDRDPLNVLPDDEHEHEGGEGQGEGQGQS